MTNLTQLMSDAAALMRQHNLAKVENLIENRKLLKQLKVNEKGMALLHDLRKYSARGLDNEAQDMQKDFEKQRERAMKVALKGRIDPATPAQIDHMRQWAATRRSAQRG